LILYFYIRYQKSLEAFTDTPIKLKIFNLDLHASVIEDVKNIANTLYGSSVDITNWSISGHNHYFGKPTADVKVVTPNTWKNIDMEMIQQFQDEYDDMLKGYDAFIVTFSPVFAMLFEKYNKPIIIVNACRYDQPFCFNKNMAMLKLLNMSLKRMQQSGQAIIVSNNMGDQQYLKKGADVDSILIPSLCLYTNTKYSNATKNEVIVFDNGVFDEIKSKDSGDVIVKRPGKYEFKDLTEYKGIIHMPYDVSSMSLFEQYFAGIPLFFPEREFYKKCVKEGKVGFIAEYGSWDRILSNEELDKWLQNADYYEFKYINYYNSFEDCVNKVNAFVDSEKDERLRWIEGVKEKAFSDWKNIFDPLIANTKIEEGFSSDDSEASCKYISSRGIRKSCDVYNDLPTKDYDTVYVHVDNMNDFNTKIQNTPYKFILVSGDGDMTFPENTGDYTKLLNNNNLIHAFIQNCSISHEKITHLPLGINYHTLSEKDYSWGLQSSATEQDNELKNIQDTLKPFGVRRRKCFSNFHFNIGDKKYSYDRKDAIEEIPTELMYYQPKELSRKETWEQQKEYAFVISPHGGGLDCHRQWEALCLGCIPIVKKSPIDSIYADLPVLIVDEWSDITEDLLNSTIERFNRRSFNYDRLLLRYWVDKINNFKE
jgi:hypothetical protein